MNKIPTALVTGASSGIGAEIARKLSNSHRVALLGRSETRLRETLESLEQKFDHFYLITDVSSESEVDQLPQKLKNKNCETLDLLVNNAGVFHREAFEQTSISEWVRQFDINLIGSVRVTLRCLDLLKKSSSANIINISSTLGLKPVPMTSAYSSSKAAMLSWTQSLALELASYNIRVNSVSPGLVETPIHEFNQTEDPETRKQIDSMQPLGFIGQPKHVASAVYFLNSKDSEWTTGSNFVVDGGISLS